MSETSPSRINNFDAIRIAAAFQVLLVHGYEHLKLNGIYPALDAVFRVLAHIPGVPIFFTVSGFLITWSFDRNPVVAQYTRNRLLRVYPGLWVAMVVSIVVLVAQGFLTLHDAMRPSGLAWFAGQVTIGQFYTPEFLRGYGMGNPNGALWTVVVELQFYALVPIVYRVLRKRRRQSLFLIAMFIASLAFNRSLSYRDPAAISTKLLGVTLAPYLFFFVTGALAYLHWDRVARFVVNRAVWIFAAFVAYAVVASEILRLYDPSYWPNAFGVVEILLLSVLTLAFAFTWPTFSRKALRGQDLSYGIYIYHCIVLNILVQAGAEHRAVYLLVLAAVSVVCAALSWRFVEHPALKRKRQGGALDVSRSIAAARS